MEWKEGGEEGGAEGCVKCPTGGLSDQGCYTILTFQLSMAVFFLILPLSLSLIHSLSLCGGVRAHGMI